MTRLYPRKQIGPTSKTRAKRTFGVNALRVQRRLKKGVCREKPATVPGTPK